MIMTKLDMLWVRACKSKNPQKRLRSVYRRLQPNIACSNYEIANILAGIVMMYGVSTFTAIKNGLRMRLIACPTRQSDETLTFFMNKLKYTNAEYFTGYIAPRRFR